MAGRSGRRAGWAVVWVLLGMAALAGPAWSAPAPAPAPAPDDPYAWFNRRALALDAQLAWLLDRSSELLGDPAALVPARVAARAHRLFATLREPVGAAASLLTGDGARGWALGARFAVNMTAGLFGTRDVAAGLGLPPDRTDLALALCRSGLGRDPLFVELPGLGPSSPPDLAGMVLTNLALYGVLGGYFYPYYVLDRIDRYTLRRAAEAADPSSAAYETVRAQYIGQRRARCGVRNP